MIYRTVKTLAILWALACVVIFPSASAAQAQERCIGAGYRQLDFLLGHWVVRDPNGNKLGENQIEKTLDGCAISENWSGNNNHAGRSYTMFDNRRQIWHQTWVDNSGLLMVMEGEFYNNSMHMRSQLQYDLQGREQHRLIWKANNLGSVQQLQRSWEISRDGGNTWQPPIVLYYSKVGELSATILDTK